MVARLRYLLDANVLIALTDTDHTSHSRATSWFRQHGGTFATCPITEGALIRYMLRVKAGMTMGQAKEFLHQIVSMPGHEFWPDSVSYLKVSEKGVTGYRQATDVYLVALARERGGKVVTLDRALSAIHATETVLIP